MTALTHRLKAATLGFCVTVAPLTIVALAQFVLMPTTVAASEKLDSNEQALAVASLRMAWLALHSTVAAIIAVYWVLAAFFGRGELLKMRAANATLGLCVVAYLAIILYYIFVPWPDGLKTVCPILDIPDSDAPRFGFDTPSSCEAFVYAANGTIAAALLGLIVPLTVSLIIRIYASRRATSELDEAASPSMTTSTETR